MRKLLIASIAVFFFSCENVPDNSVDLVITSPPYPNMTDYVTSQRLSYYFLGLGLADKSRLKDLDLEIGPRIRRLWSY